VAGVLAAARPERGLEPEVAASALAENRYRALRFLFRVLALRHDATGESVTQSTISHSAFWGRTHVYPTYEAKPVLT
jgi:hypothetical protein